jgi:hypothetical protein
MDDRGVNPDMASALSSTKSVLTIVNGLALTNTLLVLLTAGHYSRVVPLDQLGAENVIFAMVLIVNIVRFYPGNVRHLDAAYGEVGVVRAAWGQPAEPYGGLGLDFFFIFSQSLLFAITSFYINSPPAYLSLFIVLLAFDVVWGIFSQTDGDVAVSPQRFWLLNNLVALMMLVVLYMVYRGHAGRGWALDVAVGVIAVTTVADFALNRRFYFPQSAKKWYPSSDSMKVFLSAPLTQYLRAQDPSALESFRAQWGHVAKALERSGHEVFSAHRREARGVELDSPESALRASVAGLLASELVIAYVGDPPSPGVQMELGYAIASRKRLLVFIDCGQTEPYLVSGLAGLPHVEVIEIESLSGIGPVLARIGLIDAPEFAS